MLHEASETLSAWGVSEKIYLILVGLSSLPLDKLGSVTSSWDGAEQSRHEPHGSEKTRNNYCFLFRKGSLIDCQSDVTVGAWKSVNSASFSAQQALLTQ